MVWSNIEHGPHATFFPISCLCILHPFSLSFHFISLLLFLSAFSSLILSLSCSLYFWSTQYENTSGMIGTIWCKAYKGVLNLNHFMYLSSHYFKYLSNGSVDHNRKSWLNCLFFWNKNSWIFLMHLNNLIVLKGIV